MPLTESPLRQALRELDSTECFCGTAKRKGNKSLPGRLQRDLYKHVSDGYVEVWQDATDWLKHHRLFPEAK